MFGSRGFGGNKETSRIIEGEEVLGFRRLEIVGHARTQMKIRNVSLADVLRTLRNPDEKGLGIQPAGRERVRWHKTARLAIDVVFERLADRIRVIAVISVTRRMVQRRQDNGHA